MFIIKNDRLKFSVMNPSPAQISGTFRKLLTRAFIYDVIALILKEEGSEVAWSTSSKFLQDKRA